MALALVGRKGRDFFMRRGFDVRYEEVGLFQNVEVVARAGDRQHGDQGIPRRRTSVPCISSTTSSARSWRSGWSSNGCCRSRISKSRTSVSDRRIDYLFEPTPEELLDTLLPFHVAVQVSRALLESSAAEHAARMTAMDSATRNAREMVDRLTLYMNKVRQAAITREIIEIVAGAQSV